MRMFVDSLDGTIVENAVRLRSAGDREPMVNVIRCLLLRQAAEMKRSEQTLFQLFQFWPLERLLQFRLAQNHDLDQLGVLRFEVADHSELLETLDGKILRFVDDQNRQTLLVVCIDQEPFKRSAQFDHAVLRGDLETELSADGREKVTPREIRVVDDGRVRLTLQAPDQKPRQQRLPRTDLTRHENESLPRLGCVHQRGQRFFIVGGPEKETRIGRVIKRRNLESEKVAIHESAFYRNA